MNHQDFEFHLCRLGYHLSNPNTWNFSMVRTTHTRVWFQAFRLLDQNVKILNSCEDLLLMMWFFISGCLAGGVVLPFLLTYPRDFWAIWTKGGPKCYQWYSFVLLLKNLMKINTSHFVPGLVEVLHKSNFETTISLEWMFFVAHILMLNLQQLVATTLYGYFWTELLRRTALDKNNCWSRWPGAIFPLSMW